MGTRNGGGPRLLVMYDIGVAGPAEITAALGKLGQVTFAVRVNPATEPLLPLIGELADLVLIGPDERLALKLVRMRSPDAILTFSDLMITQTAAFAAELGLPYHTPATAQALTSKWSQRCALAAAGVEHTRSARITSPAQWPAAVAAAGLPAVIKPARGAGSRNTYKVDDEAAGAALAARLLAPPDPPEDELVVEEYLAGRDAAPYGDYVAVESAVQHGEVTHLVVTGKLPLLPPFREVGHFWPAVLPPGERAAVEALVAGALRALGITTGITHTEVKLTRGGPRIIEVNGRLSGLIANMGRPAMGIDLVELAGRLALGEPPPRPVLRPGTVTFMYHNPAPTQWCRLEAVHGTPQVRSMPQVLSYRAVIHPGAEIAGGVQTRWLDLLVGQAGGHQEMLATIDAALDRLSFDFLLRRGHVSLSARSLRQPLLEDSPDDRSPGTARR
jgi:ATP-grasp domain-containing protein